MGKLAGIFRLTSLVSHTLGILRILEEIATPSTDNIGLKLEKCVNLSGVTDSKAHFHENGSWIAWAYEKGFEGGAAGSTAFQNYNRCKAMYGGYDFDVAKESVSYFEAMRDGTLEADAKADAHFSEVVGFRYNAYTSTQKAAKRKTIDTKLLGLVPYSKVADEARAKEAKDAASNKAIEERSKRNRMFAAIFAAVGVVILVGVVFCLVCRKPKRDPYAGFEKDANGNWVSAQPVGKPGNGDWD